MKARRTAALLLVTAASLSACGRDTAEQDLATPEQAAQDTSAMPGMAGAGGDMMAQMEAHLQMVSGANADSLRAMLPMHRQMIANMISQFERDMRGMNMSGDAAWQATLDSVRQDNSRLTDMSGAQIQSFMPAHMGRVRRLIQMHQAMM